MNDSEHPADDGTKRNIRINTPTDEATNRPTGGRTRSLPEASRRAFLAGAGTAATISLAGCLSGNAPDVSASDEGGPEPPWTTEALADSIDADSEITIYSAAANTKSWHAFIDVINDEYGMNLESNVYASGGSEVSQRIMQERQASRDKSDVISVATEINELVHADGQEAAEEWYEQAIDQNFWFNDVVDDAYTEPWYVSAYNGGPSSSMVIHTERFDEMGLDYPETWNALFDDQYEGLETVLPSWQVSKVMGWIIGYHAEKRGMESKEWLMELQDHLNFVGSESHSSGGRAVAEGRRPFMFYNFPWTVSGLVGEFPVHVHFPKGVQWLTSASHLAINRNAPNPWVARFILSASMEESIQKRMLTDIGSDIIPGRMDLDYSAQDPSEYVQRRLNADVTPVTFEKEGEYSKIGTKARNEWIDI